jgi:F0F1-type ATP synthase assembly protein I
MNIPEDKQRGDDSQEIRDYAHEAATQSPIKPSISKQANEQAKIMREAGPYMTLGIQLVLTILIFCGIGYWLDKHFNTGSLWIAIMATFGSISSTVYFIVTVSRLQKKSDSK